jgi:putative ABC transport system substrate-binding protein
MRRREFMGLIGCAAAMWPLPILAQQGGKTRRIGYVATSLSQRRLACFKHGLRDLGWIEGQDIVIEHRWTEGRSERLTEIAAELTSLPLDLMVTTGTPVAQHMRRAIRGVPLVFMMVSDPVASGVVTNLARPEANVTGVSNLLPATTNKLPELLKEMVPRLSRIAFLYDPSNHGKVLELEVIKAAGAALGMIVEPRELRAVAAIDATFEVLARDRPEALIIPVDAVTIAGLKRIVEFAAKNNFPVIYQTREFVEAGGLMSYGLNECQHHRRGAYYVDKILRGANAAELPVEQPTTFELVINLKAAKALGLTVPPTLLARADEVIE